MITGLFLFGSLAFWGLMATAAIILLLCVSSERTFGSVFTVACTIAALYFFGDVNVLEKVVANPLISILVAIWYFLVGAGWSIAKWYLFAKDQAETFIGWKKNWLANYEGSSYETRRKQYVALERKTSGDEAIPDLTAEEAFDFEWKNDSHLRRSYGLPDPRDHKRRITNWIAWWPFSVLNALIFDFIREICYRIYQALISKYREISVRAFKGLLPDA